MEYESSSCSLKALPVSTLVNVCTMLVILGVEDSKFETKPFKFFSHFECQGKLRLTPKHKAEIVHYPFILKKISIICDST
jgi:hypothetical protein